MKSKSFDDYNQALLFRDKVDGQVQWCTYKGQKYWIVWY